MSNNPSNEQDGKKVKKPRVSRRVFLSRLLAIFLAILMLGGGIGYILVSLSTNASALSYVDGSSSEDLSIRVGLMYGSSVTTGFQTTAPYGHTVGVVDENGQFNDILQVADTRVSVTCGSNLSKVASSYYEKTSSDHPSVCGYYIYYPAGENSLDDQLEELSGIAEGYEYFPGYIDGVLCLCIGGFASYADAEIERNNIVAADVLPEDTAVGGCGETALLLISVDNDDILFAFEGEQGELALRATYDGEKEYLETPAANHYDGVFVYNRYISGSIDGVSVINQLPLEDYTMGVLPWEIGSTWPLETMKTFAVAIRSYAIGSAGKHSGYGFDVCATTCCQVYRGVDRINENVREAVSSTAGEVLTYDGEIVRTYYSSSTGGCTVSASDAWGSSTKYPFLSSVITPWEQYESYSNGSWQIERTSSDLLNRLENAGYSQLSGTVEKVEITKFAEGSTYVYAITLTDKYGHTATVTRSDTIRTVLGLYSANFVVAPAGETATVTDYSLTDEALENLLGSASGSSVSASNGGIYVLNGTGGVSIMSVGENDSVSVIGSDDTVSEISGGTSIRVLRSDGTMQLSSLSSLSEKTDAVADENGVITMTRTVVADGSAGSFIFIGRGWGHGVGMSQYGAKDLGTLSYDYRTILRTYFSGTEIVDFHSVY